jgi:hypothetical protein
MSEAPLHPEWVRRFNPVRRRAPRGERDDRATHDDHLRATFAPYVAHYGITEE